MNLNYKLAVKFFLLGIIFFPVYVFKSGVIQPGHLFFIFFFLITLFYFGFVINVWSILFILIILYIFCIETFYIHKDFYLLGLKNGLYFLFNFLLFNAVYIYYKQNSLNLNIFKSIIASGLIVLISIIYNRYYLGVETNIRASGLFNNPNQLGYYALCFFSITYLFYVNKLISFFLTICILILSTIFAFFSLSKAAMIGILFSWFFILKNLNLKYSLVLWFFSTLLLIAVIIILYKNNLFDNFNFYNRLYFMLEESDSSLQSRGYLVFLASNFFEKIFGIGEFNSIIVRGYEIHSTLAYIWTVYGLVGFLLFFLLILFWFFHLYKAYGLFVSINLVMPTMLYGITHVGFRFAIFWVFFAMSIAMADKIIYHKKLI